MIRPYRLRALPWSPRRSHVPSPYLTTHRSLATLKPRTRATSQPPSREPTELDQITTLPNGIRIATEALPGAFSGVGVYIDAGSRYENETLRGVSHIIDRLAFKSTSKRTADSMYEALETLGGNIQCASSRETLMYQSATFNASVPDALGVLAETIRDPLNTEEEVQQQLETADYEIGEIWSKPELILPELVHIAAYKSNTLGNPLLCPKERLSEINQAVVSSYRDIFYKPERMVVAFAGVQHEEAVRLTEGLFGDMRSNFANASRETATTPQSLASRTYTPPQEPSRLLSKIPFFKNISTSASHAASITDLPSTLTTSAHDPDLSLPSHYTGGYLSLPPLAPPPNPSLPRLSHLHIAFEALPISSTDIYALATLQTLLGGGGSFSAGGPGKGMYSRLYTNVLNQYSWVESAVAFNHSYTDSGLFGISASCVPAKIGQMVEVVCRELHALTLESGFSALQPGEVQRAKNQLRSSLLMNLESRMVELEDLGRQVQVHGKKVPVTEMCSMIENLTIKDLRRVARLVLQGGVKSVGMGSGAPTVVVQEGMEEGRELKEIGWGEIQQRIERWHLGRGT
jgi:processing peptidase subunit alpha